MFGVFLGGGFSFHSRIFSFGDVTIIDEGLQILTYTRDTWTLSSEGSLMYHTYCDTDKPFNMAISEDLLHLHLLPSVWQWSFFKDLGLSRPEIEPRPPACKVNALPLRNRGGNTEYKLYNMENIFQSIQSGFVTFYFLFVWGF